jgi:flagellar motor switch protein FliN/FliY
MLVINGTPFFRAKIKQGSLKILEHPLYHEVDTAMGIPPKKNEDEDENFDTDLNDSDFDIDDDSEHTEHTEHTELTEEHTDFSEFEDHPTESTEYDTEHTEHSEFDDSSFDDDEDLKPSKAKTVVPTEAAKVKQPKEEGKTTISNTPLSVDDIPLSVVIEVGRIQMSVKKLLELQPGNMLELDLHPDSGIDMVVNGRRIARGELLKIGDALGIRILELS